MTDSPARPPLSRVGPPLGQGRVVLLMLHGRGGSSESILELAPRINRPDVTYLAPAAPGRSWYPFSFLSNIEKNEPDLSRALEWLDALLIDVERQGIPRDRIGLLGFSQGACLAGEFACRRGGRYGAVIMLSGGLIGPPGTTWTGGAPLEGTPVLLGCSDRDAHIPLARVHESAAVLTRMGGRVTERIYPGMGHLVNDDEIAVVRQLVDGMGHPEPALAPV